MPSSRQLAAIMFTDIVGYTALMGKDEQKAFKLLDTNRQIQKPIIEQYDGRWIKELGDGVMASFNTVSDAVNAAIQIQRTCNASKEFQLRIGIHLGEVVFENNDVFGDGVNIASRIQAIANPGSIYISETVHNSISNKREFQTKFIKEEKLKNVKKPVRIYQVIAEGVVQHQLNIAQKIKPEPKVLLISATVIGLLIAGYFIQQIFTTQTDSQLNTTNEPIEKSIAVLPFENIGADSTQEYFSDGITESLISDLAQIPGLLVIAGNSVFQYKGKSVNPIEIGKQFNVRYVLESTLQRAGEIIRINTKLIETRKGGLVWSNKFNRTMKDIFVVQDDISRHIIDSLKIVIGKRDDNLTKSPTENLEAFEYYLRGHYLYRKAGAANRILIDSAITLFEKAVSLDPKFALAYAELGKAYTTLYFIYTPDSKWETKAYVAIEKALSLDSKLAAAYEAKGSLTWTLSNGFPHEKAVKELKHAIALNPNLVEAHENLGSIYFHIGMLDEALSELRTALTLDPASRFALPRVARVHWYQQKFDSALIGFSTLQPSDWLREHAIVLWNLGKTDEAFKALDKMGTVKQKLSYDLAAGYAVLYAGTGRKKEAEEKIKFAIENGQGFSHFHHAEHLIASAYALMGNADSAVTWLQKTADHGFPCYPLFKNDPNLKSLRNDPGYISLMEKLKKQWEYFKSSL
ncbi:MAG TPA: adenylate/guanylate cyclase domain-containing protein [Chitinophagaceae bacterium]|nr:adenylate/guanylate cyclase domain-containing protein [Chitinophagaceae bacterium]